MEKQKVNLADLKKENLINVIPSQTNSCEKVKNEVYEILTNQCRKKVNKLKKCNNCIIVHNNWPVINSQFDAQLLNTAFDGASGKLDPNNLNNGQTDLQWEVGLGDPTGWESVASWIPAYVFSLKNSAGEPVWVKSPFDNANWISLFINGGHDKSIDVYFRIKFYLNSNIDSSQFSLDMDFYADNSVHEIYINQNKQSIHYPNKLPQNQGTTPDEYNYRGFDKDKRVNISLANDWKPCENEIIVHIKSGTPYIGFLAQNASKCYEAKFPKLTPIINISWGDSTCDCIETDDTEIMCISVCNGYSNVVFKNFVIGRIKVVDENGNQVPILPDGTPSVDIHPIGPYCFGDIAACNPEGRNNCISREFVLINRGAKAGKYKILLECICFDVCTNYALNDCFEFIECYS
jgi:hypothetical protein